MISSPTSKRSELGRRLVLITMSIALVIGWSSVRAGERNTHSTYPAASRVEDPASGDVWIRTLGGGLRRESRGRVDVFDQMNSGLPGNFVYSVTLGGGRVFVATNGGACSFDPFMEEWDLLDPRRSDRPQSAVVELRWMNGVLFGRQWGLGIRRWDENSRTWTHTDYAWPDRVGDSEEPDVRHAEPRPWSVAVLGPGTRRMSLPGDESPARRPSLQPDLQAAQDAVAQMNRRLSTADEDRFAAADATPGYSRYGWSLLEDDLVSYAGRPEVLGVIVHLDDRSSYTEAATTFLKLPLVSIDDWPTKSTATLGEKQWVFRCRGDEPRRYRALLDAVARTEQCRQWTIVCDANHSDARTHVAWTRAYARVIGLPDVHAIEWNQRSLECVMEEALRGAPQAIFVWADGSRAAEFIRALRAAGSTALVVVGPDAVRAEFTRGVGEHASRVIALPTPDDSPALRTGPGNSLSVAARTFKATDHLLAAIGLGGGTRAAVRDALSRMEEDPFGERHAEAADSSARPVRIARLTYGRWQYETVSADPTLDPP